MKRPTGRKAIVLALAVLAMAMVAGNARAAGLLVADGPFGGVFEIKEHDVKVTINNGIAVTRVTQVFHNTENRQLEALYTFPVPKGASVSNFSMWINGKEMIGEVVEKQRAREIYNSYKRVRRDPGLLEQTDFRTFEMRIFPIPPNADQKVEITYYQELDIDNDWGTYVYPLATNTRGNIDSRTTGKFAVSLDVKSEIPIVEMESPSHRRGFVFAKHTEEYVQASMEATGGDLSRDVVLAYKLRRPKTGVDIVASKPANEDGYFYVTLTVGEDLAKLKRDMDYVFVLDVSGSMQNDGKLRISADQLGAFIKSLGPEDRFEVITFNVKPTMLFRGLRKADEASQTEAATFLRSQEARGGTVLNPALTTAYKYKDADRPLNVIVLSDGMTEQREREQLIGLIRQRPAGATVFCIGVGNDVNRPLLDQLAKRSGGIAAFISRDDDFERQAKAFRRKLQHPVARNLALKVEGTNVYDIEPKVLPNLYHGTPVRMYGRYSKGGPVTVTLRADVNAIGLKKTATIELPRTESGNPEIERMWAWHRMRRLQDEIDEGSSRAERVDEVIRLGEGYSIASEYTSFIVLENDAEYKRWQIDRRNLRRTERDRNAQARLGRELERLREKASQALGPVPDTKQVGGEQVAVKPNVQSLPPRQQTATPPNTTTPRPRNRSRGFDIPIPTGGGALDPLSVATALGFAAAAWQAGRRRKRGNQ